MFITKIYSFLLDIKEGESLQNLEGYSQTTKTKFAKMFSALKLIRIEKRGYKNIIFFTEKGKIIRKNIQEVYNILEENLE